MESPLHDMHCHLDFMPNGQDVAAQAVRGGSLLFSNTVLPDGWAAVRNRFAQFGNVRVGFGMHPWWVEEYARACGIAEARRRILELLESGDPPFIGEVGLDFGRRHAASRDAQLALFETICQWAARRGGKVISLHSVKAARETLDALEQAGLVRGFSIKDAETSGAPEVPEAHEAPAAPTVSATAAHQPCICVFHWFSGPSDQLKRAIEGGCYFSCGPRMLATGKGREYVKAIPANRLLLETDAPSQPGMCCSYTELKDQLEAAARSIANIKGRAALEQIDGTTRQVLSISRSSVSL